MHSQLTVVSSSSTSQHIIKSEDARKSVDLIYQLFSSIWGGSSGMLVGQSMIGGAPFLRFSALLIPCNWLIFSFKTTHWHSNDSISRKIISFTQKEKGKIICFSTAFLIHYFIIGKRDVTFPTQVAVTVCSVALNFFSSYTLQQLCPSTFRLNSYFPFNKMSEWLSGPVRGFWNVFSWQDSEEVKRENLKKDLRRQIDETREKNKKTAAQLEAFRSFIQNDSELLGLFKDCIEHPEGVLMSPPTKKGSDDSVAHPLAEEWRQTRHQEAYYSKWMTYIRDFLEKNPNFCNVLLEKLAQIDSSNQQKIHMIFKLKGE